MPGKKDNERFLFFKFVPPKKGEKSFKELEHTKMTAGSEPVSDAVASEPTELPLEVTEAPIEAEKDETPMASEEMEYPEEPAAVEYPPSPGVDESTDTDLPELLGPPAYPEFPTYPEYPEYPNFPPDSGCPKPPECPWNPEYPESPEYPEYPCGPELPEIPEIPEIPEPEGPCPENSVEHVVQAGDTYWKLAKKYGTSVEAITAANPEVDPLNLQIGQSLCIPLGIPGAKG